MTGTLNGHSQLALMAGAGAGHSARQNLRALGNIAAESGYILVINRFHFIYTEAANLLTAFTAAAAVISFGSFRSISQGIILLILSL